MIRTLFLAGILFTLAAIAFKDPGQSGWDFARDVGNEVGETISPPTSQTTRVVPGETSSGKETVAKKLSDWVGPRTWSDEDVAPADTEVDETPAEEQAASVERPVTDPPVEAPVAAPPPPPAINLEGSKTTPRSPSRGYKFLSKPLPASPRLPSAPVRRVEVGELDAPAVRRRDAPARGVNIREYREVKAFYENASRLLEEIK